MIIHHNVMIMTMTTMIAITNHISKWSGQVQCRIPGGFSGFQREVGTLEFGPDAWCPWARGLCFQPKIWQLACPKMENIFKKSQTVLQLWLGKLITYDLNYGILSSIFRQSQEEGPVFSMPRIQETPLQLDFSADFSKCLGSSQCSCFFLRTEGGGNLH